MENIIYDIIFDIRVINNMLKHEYKNIDNIYMGRFSTLTNDNQYRIVEFVYKIMKYTDYRNILFSGILNTINIEYSNLVNLKYIKNIILDVDNKGGMFRKDYLMSEMVRLINCNSWNNLICTYYLVFEKIYGIDETRMYFLISGNYDIFISYKKSKISRKICNFLIK